ncbi:hypothetical protein OsI_35911 [Oryza sativa Indica Group]|uniref:Uncharacterized protein n=1 Tax=Oryza sativa subsp. indica TaxID=39946 RepID=B8BK74_ORYSI|nr:hypothetical protein OsI_35911 [Oryza sativa Indica Group]
MVAAAAQPCCPELLTPQCIQQALIAQRAGQCHTESQSQTLPEVLDLIVLIQAHAEKSKVKCQESRPSKAFNGYKPTIDFEVTDHGLSMGTRNH